MTWIDSQRAFAEAARWFAETVAQAEGRWAEPGLGEWDVRSLVGHTSRSMLTVEAYLAQPAATADIANAADYYRATRAIAAGPDVAERGRAAGVALGDDPVAAVAEIAGRVVPLVAARTGDELLTTIAGGMRLSDYLPTRTVELVVHTCDLATALGLHLQVPARPAEQALAVLTQVAVAGGLGGDALLALTGRRGLPAGFSVL